MASIKSVAVNATQQAGKLLLRKYQNFNRRTIKLKSRHEIVTKADLASEKIIISLIKNNFPAHGILSEEAGRVADGKKIKGKNFLWIIDPLDGTTNFSLHNPLWSISVAVAYGGKIILAVVYAPFLDELYLAEKNKGAWRNHKKIKVSTTKGNRAINAFCHGSHLRDIKRAVKYFSYQKLKRLDCRQMGSAAVELAYVAGGRIESIAIPGANSWDVAAGVLLVREAGGRVTDFNGRAWNLTSRDMLASNGKMHKEILTVIKRI